MVMMLTISMQQTYPEVKRATEAMATHQRRKIKTWRKIKTCGENKNLNKRASNAEGDKLRPGECNADSKNMFRWQLPSIQDKGVVLACSQCNYEATHKGNLKQHYQSIHEGEKYSCSECNYQATQPSNLKSHQKVQHNGVKYPIKQFFSFFPNFPHSMF